MSGDPIAYLENSFLSPLLVQEGVTDISYNGESLFYVSNDKGRQRSSIEAKKEDVSSFLRQIANLTERQFSVQSPILDVSFGRYRINAVNSSLARRRNQKTYTFSLRLESNNCKITDNSGFFDKKSMQILRRLIKEGESIVIGGKVSSGKTELQKWILQNMVPCTRVIVIDNVEELDMVENENIDLTTWLVSEQGKGVSFSSLIKNALRNDPDYIVIAEARGEEMLDALLSAMSGHPIITTIHAQELEAMPHRVARLSMIGNRRLFKDELMEDISRHLRYYVYVEKETTKDGSIRRFIKEIGKLDEDSQKMTLLYEKGKSL